MHLWLKELLKLMSHFGPTIAIAFSDIKLKARKIVENRDELIKEGYIKLDSDEALFIQPFILFEIKHGFAWLDDSKNKKVMKEKI